MPLLLSLALSYLQLSTGHLLKGSVSCLNCNLHHDLSGITIAVECKHEKSQVTPVVTNDKGYFDAEIPSTSPNCFAKLLGGPEQLCSYKKSMVSRVVKRKGSNNDDADAYYALSTPLTFLSSCPLETAHTGGEEFGASKTVDLPLPKEWGLPPSSYYFPFLPIIGIP